jgi:hypothetical protein
VIRSTSRILQSYCHTKVATPKHTSGSLCLSCTAGRRAFFVARRCQPMSTAEWHPRVHNGICAFTVAVGDQVRREVVLGSLET